MFRTALTICPPRLFSVRVRSARPPLPREIPKHGLWAIEIKRGLSARPEKGFFVACEDLKPARRFVVNSGTERYPINADTEAIGLRELAETLAAL